MVATFTPWSILRGIPIDSITTHGYLAEDAPVSPRFCCSHGLIKRNNRTPSGAASIARALLPVELRANHRIQSIRANQEVSSFETSISKPRFNATRILVKADTTMAQMDSLWL